MVLSLSSSTPPLAESSSQSSQQKSRRRKTNHRQWWSKQQRRGRNNEKNNRGRLSSSSWTHNSGTLVLIALLSTTMLIVACIEFYHHSVSSSAASLSLFREGKDDDENFRVLLDRLSSSSLTTDADFSFLLDFGIIGFGKCGTSTLMQWFRSHPRIKTPFPNESWLLQRPPDGHVAMIRKLYEFKKKQQHALVSSSEQQQPNNHVEKKMPLFSSLSFPDSALVGNNQNYYKIGYKNPTDAIHPESLHLINRYFRSTRLVLVVRHPVLWLASLINFYQNEMGRKVFAAANNNNNYTTTTTRSSSMTVLSTTTNPLLQDFGADKKPSHHGIFETTLGRIRGEFHQHIEQLLSLTVTNPLFLLETTQLADTNSTRLHRLRKDMAIFLGLATTTTTTTRGNITGEGEEHNNNNYHEDDDDLLPPIPHVRPGSRSTSKKSNTTTKKRQRKYTNYKRFDVCGGEHGALRREFVAIARNASLWLRHSFLKHCRTTTTATNTPPAEAITSCADNTNNTNSSSDNRLVMVSSPEYLNEIFLTWMNDPCDIVDR